MSIKQSLSKTSLKQYVKSSGSIWNIFRQRVFDKMGGIEFMLKCDYSITKLPIKLAKYRQQVLLSWKLLYKHNFTPHNIPLWINRYILHKGNSVL